MFVVHIPVHKSEGLVVQTGFFELAWWPLAWWEFAWWEFAWWKWHRRIAVGEGEEGGEVFASRENIDGIDRVIILSIGYS